MQGEQQQLRVHLLYESLFGQYSYATQPKGSFWYHLIDTKDAVLLMYINEIILALYFPFSSRYLLELQLLKTSRMKLSGLRYEQFYNLTEFGMRCFNQVFGRLLRYGKLIVLNLFLVSTAMPLNWLIPIRTPRPGQRVLWIRSVRDSVQMFSWNWIFSFS